MKKLEDIPKKEIFSVPEGYFDKLPGVIQSRVAKKQEDVVPAYRLALRYALPVVALIAVAVFWLNRPKEVSAENLLASVETADLIAYLNDSDISTEEILDQVNFDATDASEIESAVYEFNFQDEDLESITEELDF